MTFKNCVIALLAVGLMSGSAREVAASAPPAPALAPVFATSSAGAVAWAAGGIIVVAGVLCVYDLWLKANGLKNWDGSPKVAQPRRHR